jgi:hypothetical protein
VFEPAPHSPAPPPPREPAPTEGRALRLLAEVRAAQARALWTRGVLSAVSAFLVLLLVGAALAHASVGAGQAVLALAVVAAVGLVAVFGAWLPRRRVGDDERTARLLAEQAPELNLDLLAAVELSRALGRRDDFSPELARAFLRQVDARAARHDVADLVDQRPVRRAAGVLLAAVFLSLAALAWKGAELKKGLALAFSSTEAAEPLRRAPITGDVELTYRYPAHTGLEPRTIPFSTGDVSAPAGTEVTVKTRADRDVAGAALIVNGARVPMQVERRELTGRFVLEQSGQYHVAFLSGSRVVAEGPDQALTVEIDQPPQARITAPIDGLELDPAKQAVTLRFEASDDYGLSALDLVFTPRGGEARRVSLKPDDGRTTRGSYQWDLGPLALKPGQVVTYFLEATDNDAVKGPKKGTSAVLTLKLYSSAEHRREALAKAEALWTRLVDHLADRMEAPDRQSPASVDAAVAARPIDERATQLAGDFTQLAQGLEEEREPPTELVSALLNISAELNTDTGAISSGRRFLLRLAGREGGGPPKKGFADDKAGTYSKDLARRLSAAVEADVQHSEKNVLYLEALLDRAKLDAIKELAQQLREDRRELSSLVEEFSKTKDPAVQEQLLQQMEALKARMQELQQRMAEMSKGIRDDFMNADALREMMEEQNLDARLDEVEQLVKEGKAEEALKKMQELAMEMDEFLESLDEAGERAEAEADPELERQFAEFQQNLEESIAEQEKLAERTRGLRDKYREQQKERVARQGEALKRELKERLAELEQSWKTLEGERFGFRFEEMKNEALQARDHVQQALEANDFDLASEAADRMEEKAREMAAQAQEQRRLDELFHNPPEVKRESKQAFDRLARDAKRSEEVAQKLRDLFPQAGQQMSEADRQQLGELARQQKQLQQKAQQMEQQMNEIGERAPIFDEDAQQQMQQAAQRMQGAGERLQGRDPSRGYGEQQGALQSLQGLQQALEQAGNRGKKGGMPMPLKQRGRGRGNRNEKVELPDDDPNAAPREFRKDVMDAMKQGAPDRYRDQNKRYYEELVK